MGKHKTKEDWKYWFDKYELGVLVWDEYFETTKVIDRKGAKKNFRRKYWKWKAQGDIIIISMTGKYTKGRPRKEELDLEDFTRDELEQIARRYYEITKKKPRKEKDKETSSFSMSKSKLARIISVSRSSLYYVKKEVVKRDPEIEKIIFDTFMKYGGIFGRDRIAAITGINYRRVGRYMNALGLECKVRKPKRKRETKNTKVDYKDLVKRQYNLENVIATDVSYIPTSHGFAYLSIAINHKTKKIESWNFSRENDNKLVMDHFEQMDLSGMIVHSDHGYQYSSNEFKRLSVSKNFKISMSRVGNSLDNREAEYFFSNIKTECLDSKTSKLNFDQVRKLISEYINWYNKERPQSILQWKTPEQFAQMRL